MTSEQLKVVYQTRPFKPFTLHMADGTSVDVSHPELLLHTQGGRTIIVNTSGEEIVIIDLLLVTKITRQNDSAGTRRKK